MPFSAMISLLVSSVFFRNCVLCRDRLRSDVQLLRLDLALLCSRAGTAFGLLSGLELSALSVGFLFLMSSVGFRE